MAVTIKDIARKAGVSHATVSRALRDSPAVSPTTIDHIKQVAVDMGYVPNYAARGLKTKRSNVLGVIIRRFDDPFFSRVLDGIEDVLQAEGYSLFLAASGHNPVKDEEIIASMAERRVDGVILCSKRIDDKQREKLRSIGISTVLINEQSVEDAAFSVGHDDVLGGTEITNHLLELGHRRIAFVANSNAGLTSQRRQLGYQAALTAAGIIVQPEYVISIEGGQPKEGAAAVQKLIALEEMPTAIVCFNDLVAVGAIHSIIESGLSVPHDVSVTGFDDIALAEYVTPALTTFRQPKYEIGRRSAEMMLSLLNSKEPPTDKAVQLRGELIVRKSTALSPTV